MQKLDHQFNFHLEHEKLIFTIPVGSKLIGVENSESDEDFLSIYTHNVIKNPFFVFPIDNEVTSVDYKNSVMQETSSITAAHIIPSILNPRSLRVFDRTFYAVPPIRVSDVRRRSVDEIGVATLWFPPLWTLTATVPVVGTVILKELSRDNNNNRIRHNKHSSISIQQLYYQLL